MNHVKTSIIVILISGCATYASPGGPIVDMYGVNHEQYQYDRAQCAAYANEVRATEQAVRGAAVGAAVGGVLGAVIGDGRDAARGAGSGAVIGAAKGGIKGVQERSKVIRNCLRNRGYSVLN